MSRPHKRWNFLEKRHPQTRLRHTRGLDYLQISREIYTAVERLSSVPSLISLSSLAYRLVFFSLPTCGGTVVRSGGADRENHTTRGRGEIDSRCDAGDENAARERRTRSRMGGWRNEGKAVVSGYWEVRAIIVRCSLQKVPDPGTSAPERGIRVFEYVPPILDPWRAPRRPRTTKCLGERNFREVKTLRDGVPCS